ncbi:hypothetical protein [Sphingomonas sp. VDB2]|uniref:hypothetical protein n=1 Tax=Sphingomonas sp. VDB2 TaxID=3228751 RepID=UPI003A7FFA5B
MQSLPLASVFSHKYDKDVSDWGGHSGSGSSPYHTMAYRMFLEQFIALNNIRSVTDVGCGDWQFSKFINYDGVSYQGYDVVPTIVAQNIALHSSDDANFDVMPDDVMDVRGGDLLIMKDVLQHLPDDVIMGFAAKLFPKFKYCLLTNSYRKLDTPQNIDIETGGFRCLDLTEAPYNVAGTYVLQFNSPLWEELRVLLVSNH